MKFIRENLVLALTWGWLILALLVSFPNINGVDGVDFDDLTAGASKAEIKFEPSLDFDGGNRLILDYNGIAGDLTDSQRQLILNQTSKLIEKNKLGEYSIFSAYSDNKFQLLVDLPKSSSNPEAIAQALSYGGKVEIARIIYPQEETDPQLAALGQTQEPQFIPITEIPATDIRNIKVVYGSEYRGWGYITNFKDENLTQLLINGASDLNQQSQLAITINGEPVAYQSVAMNSASLQAQVSFATPLSIDRKAVEILADKITSPVENSFTTSNIISLGPDYPGMIAQLQIVSLLALIAISFYIMYKKKIAAIPDIFNFIFFVVTFMSMLKLVNLELSMSSYLAIVFSVAAGFILYIKVFGLEIILPQTLEKLLQNLRPKLNKIVLLNAVLLLILNLVASPVVMNVTTVLTAFIICLWLTLMIAVPNSIKLVRFDVQE